MPFFLFTYFFAFDREIRHSPRWNISYWRYVLYRKHGKQHPSRVSDKKFSEI